MTNTPKRHTRSAGVTFEVPVLDYLQEMALAQSRDRSFCINQIIREHAARNGQSLPPAVPPGDDRFSSGEA